MSWNSFCDWLWMAFLAWAVYSWPWSWYLVSFLLLMYNGSERHSDQEQPRCPTGPGTTSAHFGIRREASLQVWVRSSNVRGRGYEIGDWITNSRHYSVHSRAALTSVTLPLFANVSKALGVDVQDLISSRAVAHSEEWKLIQHFEVLKYMKRTDSEWQMLTRERISMPCLYRGHWRCVPLFAWLVHKFSGT
jgi:hypothetical protein